jgi:uncharacterized membrane protein (DUF441 family)
MVEFSDMFWFATVAKIIALALGAFIVYLAYMGYRRNTSRPLLFAALGFAFITAGTIIEGILYVLLGTELLAATATGTLVTILGFVTVIYSIYSTK